MRPIFLLMAALAAAPVAAAPGQPALLHSDPAQGAVTGDSPPAVRLRFNQPMRLERLQLFDGTGREVPVRLSRDRMSPAVEQRGGLLRIPAGDYRAEWAASSPAGQPLSGTLTFRVVEPAR